MKTQRLCTVAALTALSLAGIAGPAGTALARTSAHHHKHRAVHQQRTRHFVAEVVRSNASGLLLRAKNGKLLSFSTKQIRTAKSPTHHAHVLRGAKDVTVSSGNVVVNVLGLQPGTVVQVTETVGAGGSISITITLPPATTSEQASGVVTDVETDSFTLESADGVDILLHMDAGQLAQLALNECDTVDVTYHDDSGVLIADSVNPTGSSSDGDCAPTTDTDGVITQVNDGNVTIDTGQGTVSFAVDPSSGLTDGFQQGDLVDVTSTTNADGSLQAVDINYVEEQVSGTVTSVTTSQSGGSLTVADSDSGDSVTVYADPANGVEIEASAFNGISVGDEVTVSYHQAAGQLIADVVCED